MKQTEIIDGNQQMETGGEEMQIPRERGRNGKREIWVQRQSERSV